MTATPRPEDGSAVSKNVSALLGVATMRLIGPRFLANYFKKVYDGLAASQNP